MSLIGAAAISGASGLMGGLINKIGQKKTEQRQVKYQKELADYQYSKDMDMWSKSNEYNKPGAQMARLKEAGLNPHLVYGTGTATGNTAPASSPKYQNPGTQFKNVPIADPSAMLSQYTNLKQTQQNIATMKANENLINAKAGTEYFNTALKELTGKKLGLDISYMPQTQAYNWAIKSGILGQQQQSLNKTIQEIQGQKKRNTYQDMINKRGKQGIFQGDNNLKTLWQMIQSSNPMRYFDAFGD